MSEGTTATKVCSACGERKPLSEFNKQANCKDGLAGGCRECRKRDHREFKKANPDRVRAWHKAWQEKNPRYSTTNRLRQKRRPKGETSLVGLSEEYLESVRERFWGYVEKGETCWYWSGSYYPTGYGCLWVDYSNHPAHRVAYELLIGPIPEGMELHHACVERRCVNPEHLELLTHEEHMRLHSTKRKAARS